MNELKHILIIGNSGSGKSGLGTALSQRLNIPLFPMDTIRWDKDGYEIRRSALDINKDLDSIKMQDLWILEGVFGKMADAVLPFASLLIWLDLPWAECKQNLITRGPQFEGHLNPTEKENALIKLIAWASEHQSRADTNSWIYFHDLYTKFKHKKIRLRSRENVSVFLNKLPTFL